ncbi:MAG: helix-turn-helix domain-containing protein [Elusimicrobiaceae bacterium]|nr:helix-turn-helix domain-containing protein [Elusimicrobiaceae bacterium]
MEGFYKRLVDELEFNGLTLAALAKNIGVADSTVRNFKNNVMPKADLALKIADSLNLNLEWLISGEGQKYKDGRNLVNYFELSGEKREILDALDIFDQRDKEDILSTIRAKKERYKIFVFDGKKKAVRDC